MYPCINIYVCVTQMKGSRFWWKINCNPRATNPETNRISYRFHAKQLTTISTTFSMSNKVLTSCMHFHTQFYLTVNNSLT